MYCVANICFLNKALIVNNKSQLIAWIRIITQAGESTTLSN